MAASKISGSCLCGGVQYEYTCKPDLMVNCHCTMCRRAIGASYGTFIQVPTSEFKMVKDGTIKAYTSSENVKRHFCGNCGANIMDTITTLKDYVYLTAGTVTGDPGIGLTGHIFTNYKAPWIKIDDGVPSSGEMELYEQLMAKKK